MKPNINDPASFSAVKDKLTERGVSKASIETLKRALDLGFEVKSRADIRVLDIPTVEADILINEVSIGPSVPPAAAAALKTFKFVAKGAIANDGRLYGYQFLLGYTDNDNNTLEESYPIADTQTVITDVSRADMRDNTEVSWRVKTPQGTYAKIAKGDVNTPLTADVIMVREGEFDAATISVEVETVTGPNLNPVTGSYQVSGKLICKDTDVEPDGYQIIILASVAELSDGTPEYFPVAYATSENNGYFLSSFLAFSDQADIRKVGRARAIVAKDDYQAEFEIKPIPIVEIQDNEPATAGSMIPRRVILVIDRSIPHTGDKDCKCGCSSLNFHNKKIFEEFSYHTVVRTTEPSVIADVIEEEEEIDLADIYGDAAGGIRVPIKIFRKFHEIRTRQRSIVPFVNNAAMVDAANMPNAGVMARAIPTDGVGTNTPIVLRRPPIFSDFDRNLLNRLTVDAKAEEIADPNRKRVHKGRVHLTPLNQVHWDNPTIYQAASIAHGHLLRFKQEWMPDGYSIGDLLYSLPLAPGQKKQIAVLDWERRESAANSQQFDYEESLNNTLIRDRDISEVVSATLSESLRGRSTAKTSGFGAGFGAAAMGVIKGISFGSVLGISGGSSKSSSTASQDSSRTSTGNSLQSIRDRTMQAANAVRSQRSTVIQTVSQGERVQATSESIANYNHCHAITIQYFEVLRHFAIRNRFVDAQECLFVPLQISNFNIDKILRWRNTLENRLLVPGLRGAFAAVERIQNERESATENYYDSIGYPRVNFAEQNIVSFQGELFVEFYFFNTKDTVDTALIEFFKKFFRVDLGSVDDYKDRKLTDAELSRMVGPRTIEHLLDAMVIETENGVNLNLDVTLITPFRQNGRLQISLRPSGPISIPRNAINGIKIRIDAAKVSSQDATSLTQFSDKYMKILVRSGSLRYRTNNFSGTLLSTRIDNDLFVGTDSVFIPTPLNNDELRNPRGEDVDTANTLIHHLNENLEYYHKAIWFDMTPERRYMLLDGITAPGKANGRSVASVVENTIIGVAGNSLIMPVAPGNQLDPTINDDVDLFARYYTDDNEPMHITLPTKGVYAEAVIGQCNSCEEKDESRFWRWEESPIPDSPNTQINPLNTDTRRTDPGNLQPKDFANPMVNIQNAPAVPDPTGLQNLTNLLGKSDLFRDVTGLTENQKNALATFQKSMDTAQAFGKEAADLAKTAGMIDLIKNAKRDGNLTNEQAKEKTGKAIDKGLESKDPALERLNKGAEIIKKLGEDGFLTPDAIKEAKENLIKSVFDNDVSKNLDRVNKSQSGEVSIKKPDGTEVSTKFDDTPSGAKPIENRIGRGGITPMRQENVMACWATVATMMLRWKDARNYTIEEVLAKAGQKYVDYYRNKRGLPYSDKIDFIAGLGMDAEPPASFSASAYRDMLLAFGPLWVTIDADDTEGFSAHALILTGISNDLATMEVIDPASGSKRQVSFDDFSEQFSSVVLDGSSVPSTQIVHFAAPVTSSGEEEEGAPSMAKQVNEYDPSDSTAIIIDMSEFSTGITGIRNYRDWATDSSIPHNKTKNGYRKAIKVMQIVLHESAADTGDGFDDSDNETSHLSVKRDATILQLNDLLELENHTSGLNSTSIGIEFVNRGWLSSSSDNGGEGIPARESDLTTAKKTTYSEANGYLWTFWGYGFGIYRVPPSLDQLEKEVELLTWLTDILQQTINQAPVEFQDKFPWFEKIWLQLVSYDDVESVWTFKDVDIPPDAEKADKKFFVMTTGYDYLTPSKVKTKKGIISHNATYEDHSDGSFLALYTWLRMEKGKDKSKAYDLCKTLMKQHWFRVSAKSDSSKKVMLLKVDDVNLV